MQKILLLTFLAMAVFVSAKVNAGGPWSDQYCNLTTETIIIKDVDGNVIDKQTVEKVKCEDGVKDFLHGAGIADSCQYFTWKMPLANKMVDQRSIVCRKLNGEGYEIVPGYHYIK